MDWDALFDGFKATADAPACMFWREIAAHYPQAKVILAVRDPEGWFESTQATIASPEIAERMRFMPEASAEMLHKVGWHPADAETHDRTRMIARFHAHNAEVKRTIAPERLLVIEPPFTWEPLCAFLGVPVPDAPFPRINSRDDFRKMITAMIAPENIREAFQEQLGRQRGAPST